MELRVSSYSLHISIRMLINFSWLVAIIWALGSQNNFSMLSRSFCYALSQIFETYLVAFHGASLGQQVLIFFHPLDGWLSWLVNHNKLVIIILNTFFLKVEIQNLIFARLRTQEHLRIYLLMALLLPDAVYFGLLLWHQLLLKPRRQRQLHQWIKLFNCSPICGRVQLRVIQPVVMFMSIF